MYVIVTENEQELLELIKEKKIKVFHLDDTTIEVTDQSKPKQKNPLYANVSEFLIALGIKPHIKGFQYLEYIFEHDIDFTKGITKVLYPKVAKAFNSTSSRVERAIRHAIETAIYDYQICEMYAKLFGNFVDKPTNQQFIVGCKVYLKNNPIY